MKLKAGRTCASLWLCSVPMSIWAADAGQAPGLPEHRTSANVHQSVQIDGSLTPHLIPDAAAIAMFTEMLAALQQTGEHQPALAFMQQALGLSDTDFATLQDIANATTQRSVSAKADALAALCRDAGFTGLYDDSANLPAISRRLAAIDSELDEGREKFFESRVSAELGPAASVSIKEWIDANL
ncbi:MAG: hypothetical protein SV422_10535, partial [Pseudomonadota bacterium]|nr:hypothetical protein [Pseudomonadota bacterium]